MDRRAGQEAKRLLADSDRSAARIAGRLGFSGANHFSRYFHYRTGTSTNHPTGRTPITFRETVGTPRSDPSPAAPEGRSRRPARSQGRQ
ncbi:helix-turn-helix domain-containing protein [Streptomyces djakartensis]|uniref:helix-turn-helix domain-containing protein n=1 Tax=Streptomyces djakartensis TaxID=68193 RepID=UPI00357132C1